MQTTKLKKIVKHIFQTIGVDPRSIMQKINAWSIRRSLSENGVNNLIGK